MTLSRIACLITATLAAPWIAEGQTVDASSAIRMDKAAKAKKTSNYVGVFGGSTSGQHYTVGASGRDFSTKEKSGATFFGIEVGHSWKTGTILEPAIEFEAFYLSNEVSAQTTEGAFSNYLSQEAGNENRNDASKKMGIKSTDNAAFISDINAVVFMLNAQVSLDFKVIEPWIPDKNLAKAVTALKPYIGAGVGGAQLWFRNTQTLSYAELLEAAKQEFPDAGQPLGAEQVETNIVADGKGGFVSRTVTIRTDAEGNVIDKTRSGFTPATPPPTQFPEIDRVQSTRIEKVITPVSSRPGFNRVSYVTTTTYENGSTRKNTRFELEDGTVTGLQGRSGKNLLGKSIKRGYRNKTATSASIASGTTSTFAEDKFVFAYQWYAGLEVKLNERVSLYGEYREITLDDFEPVRDFTNEVWNAGLRLRY